MAGFSGNDDLVYTNLNPPGFQEEVYTNPNPGNVGNVANLANLANVQSGSNNEPVEFMKNFRAEMVTHPGMTSVVRFKRAE